MMRILILSICLMIVGIGKTYSQRHYPGQKGLQFTGAMVDGLRLYNNTENYGYSLGTALSTYTGNGNHWTIGIGYLEKRYWYETMKLPVAQITGEGGYYLNFLSNRGKDFFLSLGLSAMAGYETVNWSKSLLPDGATIQNKDAFIYGGALTIEAEIFLTDYFAFLMHARERVLFGSSVSKFHTEIGVGLKLFIN